MRFRTKVNGFEPPTQHVNLAIGGAEERIAAWHRHILPKHLWFVWQVGSWSHYVITRVCRVDFCLEVQNYSLDANCRNEYNRDEVRMKL